MAALTLNKITLCGRLTADVELKQTTTGRSVVQFDIAVNRPRPRDGSEQKADFIRCVAWDKTAEFISKYFHKGDSIYVEGSLHINKYKDGVGRLVISSEINLSEARFVDSRSEAASAPVYSPAPPAEFTDASPDDDLPF